MTGPLDVEAFDCECTPQLYDQCFVDAVIADRDAAWATVSAMQPVVAAAQKVVAERRVIRLGSAITTLDAALAALDAHQHGAHGDGAIPLERSDVKERGMPKPVAVVLGTALFTVLMFAMYGALQGLGWAFSWLQQNLLVSLPQDWVVAGWLMVLAAFAFSVAVVYGEK